jgi:hypothetical protein
MRCYGRTERLTAAFESFFFAAAMPFDRDLSAFEGTPAKADSRINLRL